MAENYLAVEVQDVHYGTLDQTRVILDRLGHEGIEQRNVCVIPHFNGVRSRNVVSSLRAFRECFPHDEFVIQCYDNGSPFFDFSEIPASTIVNSSKENMRIMGFDGVKGVSARGWDATAKLFPVIAEDRDLKYALTPLSVHDFRTLSGAGHVSPALRVYGDGGVVSRVVGVPRAVYNIGARHVSSMGGSGLTRVVLNPSNVRHNDLGDHALRLLDNMRRHNSPHLVTYTNYLGLQ